MAFEANLLAYAPLIVENVIYLVHIGAKPSLFLHENFYQIPPLQPFLF